MGTNVTTSKQVETVGNIEKTTEIIMGTALKKDGTSQTVILTQVEEKDLNPTTPQTPITIQQETPTTVKSFATPKLSSTHNNLLAGGAASKSGSLLDGSLTISSSTVVKPDAISVAEHPAQSTSLQASGRGRSNSKKKGNVVQKIFRSLSRTPKTKKRLDGDHDQQLVRGDKADDSIECLTCQPGRGGIWKNMKRMYNKK